MPQVILPKSRFLHIPKCGGSWAALVLSRHVHGAQTLLPDWMPFDQLPYPELPTITTLRPADDWLRSYFSYRERTGWPGEHLDHFRGETFQQFAGNVLDAQPRTFDIFLSQRIKPNVLVLRMANMNRTLPRLLQFLGETADFQAIERTPRYNVSDSEQYEWDEAQRVAFLEANTFAVRMYELAW